MNILIELLKEYPGIFTGCGIETAKHYFEIWKEKHSAELNEYMIEHGISDTALDIWFVQTHNKYQKLVYDFTEELKKRGII